VEEWAQKIGRVVYAGEAERNKLKDNGKKRVKAMFTFEVFGD